MRLSSDNGRWMLKGVGGLGAAVLLAVACAGGDTPPRDAELVAEILARYDNAVGQAGSASMGGSGGGGQGGSGQGGSVSNAGAGGSGTGAAGSGAGGSGSAGMSGGGDYCDAPTIVLKPACGIGSGCHGAGAALGDFGEDEASARALVDVETRNGCGPYIDSANPEDSQILIKLGADTGGCGAQMPFLNDPLIDSEVACVRDWLSQF